MRAPGTCPPTLPEREEDDGLDGEEFEDGLKGLQQLPGGRVEEEQGVQRQADRGVVDEGDVQVAAADAAGQDGTPLGRPQRCAQPHRTHCATGLSPQPGHRRDSDLGPPFQGRKGHPGWEAEELAAAGLQTPPPPDRRPAAPPQPPQWEQPCARQPHVVCGPWCACDRVSVHTRVHVSLMCALLCESVCLHMCMCEHMCAREQECACMWDVSRHAHEYGIYTGVRVRVGVSRSAHACGT